MVAFPWDLRRTLAFDETAARAVFRIAGEVISAWISGAAADDGVFGNPAGLLHIQRFGDGLTLNPHGHFVFSDAVFCPVATAAPRDETDAPPPVLSYRTRPPTITDLQAVADQIEIRACRFLARHAAAADGADPSPEDLDRAHLGGRWFHQRPPRIFTAHAAFRSQTTVWVPECSSRLAQLAEVKPRTDRSPPSK